MYEADEEPALIVGANCRLENAKSAAAMLQEKPLHDKTVSMLYLDVVFTMYTVSVLKFVTAEILSFSRMTNRHGHGCAGG